jgi:hypothetical protein
MSTNMVEARARLRKALYDGLSNEQTLLIGLAEVLMLLNGSPSLIEELTARGRQPKQRDEKVQAKVREGLR